MQCMRLLQRTGGYQKDEADGRKNKIRGGRMSEPESEGEIRG